MTKLNTTQPINTATDVDKESKDIKTVGAKKLMSSRLFEASKEVMIEHDNEIYFLRLTRQNKLILTK